MEYICEICGAPFEGEAAPCGGEICEECCDLCFEADCICGYRTLDAVSQTAE